MKLQYGFILAGILVAFSLSVSLGTAPVGAAGDSALLKGTVKFEGTAPKPSHIDMSADPICAKAHPSGGSSEEVVVGADGGLDNVVVYVSDGLTGKTFPPPPQPVQLEQKGCEYKPHVLAVQANQTINIVNDDETTHNIHPSPNNNREWNMTQPHGVALDHTFAREEVAIPVKCNVHPWMKGYIAVFKHPYFAVTDKSGGFEIKDLPPGTYTITAWQEKLGTQTGKITVAAGETKTLDLAFKQ